MLRVLALTHVFPRSAADPAAPFLLPWAQGLAAAQARVVIVAPHDAGLPPRHTVGGIAVRRVRYAPDRSERLAYQGRMHELVRSPSGPPLLAGLAGALAAAVRAQVRAGAPDVVHVHWWLPGAIVARLARPAAPVVVTVHGTDVALVESRPALARVARWALAAADRVEAVSTDLAERLERATGRAADAVNPMPLAVQRAPADPPAPTGRFRVLAVGRLVPDKGFADLIAAVARLDGPTSLTIIGDGPQRAALAALARRLGVDLHLPGRLPPAAVARAHSHADVLAQPSHREGFGLAAAEALAAGLPVVATDSGGVRDLLPRSALPPPGDIPALRAALATIAGDPATARTHARTLAAPVRHHLSPTSSATRTLTGYAALSAS